jgi:hypothetical protein
LVTLAAGLTAFTTGLAAGFLATGFAFVAVALAFVAGTLVAEGLIAFPLVGAAVFLAEAADVLAGFKAM